MLQDATEYAEHPPSWLLVVGHYPIYSAGSNGDTAELSTTLLPLLLKYKVHAYLCGHDHISEHLHKDGIEYFVAGAGSMTDQLKYTSQAELIWSGVGYSAYASMEATVNNLTISYRDWNNTLRYSYTLTNPMYVPPFKPPGPGIILPVVKEDDATDDNNDNAGMEALKHYDPAAIVVGSFIFLACTGVLVYLYIYRTTKYNPATKQKKLQSGSASPKTPHETTTYNILCPQTPVNSIEDGLEIHAVEHWKLNQGDDISWPHHRSSSEATGATTTGPNTPISRFIQQSHAEGSQAVYRSAWTRGMDGDNSDSDASIDEIRVVHRSNSQYMSL
jgi:hypothetical protein